ncbi:MAG: STAS domain-containing protein [Acidobacteria bacterium]|nr:STAS domain-containing protein [Acidobacteriota bacterium]
MRLEERTVDKVTVVQIHGDIVLNGSHPSVADRVRHLLEENHRRIVLDLADARYVDSGGLGEIVESFTAAKNRGGTVKLLGITRRLNDLLVITKLLDVFECFETEAEAVQSFGDPEAVR